MKSKRLGILILILSIFTSIFFTTACGSKQPKTLEDYLSSDNEIKTEIDKAISSLEEQNINVLVEGNDIICTYDLSTIEGLTEEIAKDEALKESLESSLDDQSSTFSYLASNMSNLTGIDGIQVIVKYIYGDEIIVNRSFTPEKE